MANFVLLYSGGSAGTTPAEREKVMQAWGGWFGRLGNKIVDAGNPFAEHAKNVSNRALHDGPVGNPPATGHSILTADSRNAPAELAKRRPLLQSAGTSTDHALPSPHPEARL